MAIIHLTSPAMEKSRCESLDDLLSELAWPEASAVSLFEVDETARLWRVSAYYEAPLDMPALGKALEIAGFPPGVLTEQPLPDIDWVAESLKGLAPVPAGRFFVHGAHDRGNVPATAMALEIDAGVAFGTGHHGTTRGCLLALQHIARTRRPRRALDVGCGTGVLAIAAARLWRIPVIASDLDPLAAATTAANARRNRTTPFVRPLAAPGVRHSAIRAHAPYDLVMANILAGPLKRMAGEISATVAPGGYLVLSGLLHHQENMLLAAYRPRGLELTRRIHIEGWSTLVLRKGRGRGSRGRSK